MKGVSDSSDLRLQIDFTKEMSVLLKLLRSTRVYQKLIGMR